MAGRSNYRIVLKFGKWTKQTIIDTTLINQGTDADNRWTIADNKQTILANWPIQQTIKKAIAFKEGDIIQPTVGRDKNKKFTVTSFTDGRVYAKPKAGMIKSFLPHEVVKL